MYRTRWHFGARMWPLALVAGFLVAGPMLSGEKAQNRKLAVLLAVPEKGEVVESMYNDQQLLYEALRGKGFDPTQILTLSGPVTRAQALCFLCEAGKRTANWPDGVVFVHCSAGGYFPPNKSSAKGDQTGIALDEGPDPKILWNEIFSALNIPERVHVVLLPDVCYINTLAPGHSATVVPKNYTGIIFRGAQEDIKCTVQCWVYTKEGRRRIHGVISYYAAQALAQASTTDDWVQRTMTLLKSDIDRKVVPEDRMLALVPLGNPKQTVLGPLAK